ncbi:MAG: hypothetical protein DRJ42_22425 [Deltaproteobacteria bacterium]|nr:MAG: hypothetical protein DRJ42_22425 [Deltaproteobacteria bacterium]
MPALLHLARSNHLAASHLARVVQSAVNKVQPVELRAAAALVGRDVNEDALWLAYADLRDGERSSATFARTLRAMEHLPEPRAAEFVSHIAALPGCAPLLAMAAGSPNLTAKVRSRVFVALEFDRRLLSEVVIDALTGAVREDDDPDLVDSALKCFRARKIRWRHDPREHARRLIEADPAMLGRAGAADALESLASQVAEAVDNVARDDLVMALCVDTEPLRRRLVLRAIHRVPPLPDAHIELLVTAYRRRLQDPAQRKDAGIDVFHFRQLAAAMSRTKEPHED